MASANNPRRRKGTVASLHPSPAITVIETARIIQAAQLMAAKKMDCVLAVNANGQLSGILTDKDIAYRVVANGLDIRTTTVRDVMTRDPVAVFETGPRNDALGVMVGRRFRHLPVISKGSDDGLNNNMTNGDENDSSDDGGTNVVGVLDITKCVFDKLDELSRKVQADGLANRCPDLLSVVRSKTSPVSQLERGDSIQDAAILMRDHHETGVLVVDMGKLTLEGILTTKDVVSRCVAQGLEADETAVEDIMTPNPKSASPSTSILDALKLLHAGHYLHLPVCDGATPIGLVDVLTLTISMLDYMLAGNQTSSTTAETSGPLWNQFWNSTWSAVDSESNAGSEAFSDDHPPHAMPAASPARFSNVSSNTYYAPSAASNRGSYPQQRTSLPAQVRSPVTHYSDIPGQGLAASAAAIQQQQQFQLQQQLQAQQQQQQQQMQMQYARSIGATSPTTNNGESVYNDDSRVGIKLTDAGRGKVLRFHVTNTTTLAELRAIVAGRLGLDKGGVGPGIGKLSYEDDDGDWVLLSSDSDLDDAIGMARRLGEKLNVRVGDVLQRGGEEEAQTQIVGIPTPGAASVSKDDGADSKNASNGSVVDFLKDAPLPVNVAISAGIVVAAAFVLSRLSHTGGGRY
ncbi:hypothetical protein HDU83_007683 [Entophlyctis luteolus]|nr:hypothetical protein HDU83_007683 [Entophlyctis luteolus]KAJ3382235.1 hypothetical protein HDU84_004408 [Entophlyctis sp. JEL0112]